MKNLIRLENIDNTAVTAFELKKGESVTVETIELTLADDVSPGHKIALCDIKAGENIIKYGLPIGHALSDIPAGGWIHSHNLKTNLSGKDEYEYNPVERELQVYDYKLPEIRIYPRKNGRAGIRNELWIVPTTGCVNGTASTIVEKFLECGDRSGVDGVHTFSHPYGCSQLGDDHNRTRTILQNIVMNPNAGGVLVLGLGCENNQIDAFQKTMPEGWDEERVFFLEAQSVGDEIEEGVKQLEALYAKASADKRVAGDFSDLVIGLECGGSDAFSGITANPLIGLFSDYVISRGGSTVLTEVPEMFGAEHILMEQCDTSTTFEKTVKMVNDFKDYYQSHNQPIYENPSPGNKKGGITTLEEKSLGCTKKAGNSKVVDVVDIDQIITKKGLNLLSAPGNDIIATTALGTAGCQMVLFSTGRGNPLGGFIPTFKISSNTALFEKKPHWIDHNAGEIADDAGSTEEVLRKLMEKVISVVNGERTRAENIKVRDISIFKTGVIL